MKRIFSFAAIAAIALASCAKNEVTEVNTNAPGYISLEATTVRGTRAEAIKADALSDPASAGFVVYANLSGKNVWYTGGDGANIDGSNNHKYIEGQWKFAKEVKWPTADYPMTFYGYYAKSYTGLSMTPAPIPAKMEGEFTVQAKAADQVDFLAGKVVANNKPVSSSLSITLKHILSKVNYGAKVPNGFNAHVMTVGLENVANKRTYDFRATAWLEDPALAPADCASDYLYIGKLGANEAITTTVSKFTGNGNGDASPFYNPAITNANLMLVPQKVDAQNWNYPTVKTPTQDNLTHVSSFYRVEKTELPGDKNYIGYEFATSHPNYENSQAAAKHYTGPLYVKAGYPYTLNWAPGKGYTYNLAIPGGVYLSKKLFDKDGNETDLPVIGVEEGDPIVSNDEYIHLIPTVDNWDSSNTIGLDK